MNRDDFQRICRQRRREAAALLNAGWFPGAYYLAGYSVECALKACVAKRTRRYDFPDKKLANEAWTHNLDQLIASAGLKAALEAAMDSSPELKFNWTTVKDWSEADRYDVAITSAEASELYSACTARKDGILSWIRRRW